MAERVRAADVFYPSAPKNSRRDRMLTAGVSFQAAAGSSPHPEARCSGPSPAAGQRHGRRMCSTERKPK